MDKYAYTASVNAVLQKQAGIGSILKSVGKKYLSAHDDAAEAVFQKGLGIVENAGNMNLNKLTDKLKYALGAAMFKHPKAVVNATIGAGLTATVGGTAVIINSLSSDGSTANVTTPDGQTLTIPASELDNMQGTGPAMGMNDADLADQSAAGAATMAAAGSAALDNAQGAGPKSQSSGKSWAGNIGMGVGALAGGGAGYGIGHLLRGGSATKVILTALGALGGGYAGRKLGQKIG